jgi:ATP-dependent RNA helicase RhlE
MSFESFGLDPRIQKAISEEGYTEPTPIQAQAIPVVLQGGDVMGAAQTGTGKTAGFTLPILQLLGPAQNTSPSPARHPVRALILLPTRELALQVSESVATYGRHMQLRSTCVFGGVDIGPQLKIVRAGVEILIATPGRLLDHVEHKSVNLGQVQILVLDEADRMLDMGFMPDIKRIMAALPRQRQNLLFSATFSDEIRQLAQGLLHDPLHIQVEVRNSTVATIAQKVLPVEGKRKAALLLHLVRENNWFQVLVFTRTKHGANRLATQLDKNGVPALAIHGNKSQNARTRALADFKSGKLQVLVATDIASRGLDIDNLPHVVNFDLPHVPEDYVHRIGRTGRAGASGEAISLVAPEERGLLRDIERVIRRQLPVEAVTGFESIAMTHEADADRPPRTSRPPQRSSAPRRPAPAAKHHASPRRASDSRRSHGDGTAPAPAKRAADEPARRPVRGARPQRSDADPQTRANLPPGWTAAAKRGR